MLVLTHGLRGAKGGRKPGSPKKIIIGDMNENDADSTGQADRRMILQKKLNTAKMLREPLLPDRGMVETDVFVVGGFSRVQRGALPRWKHIQMTSILEKHLCIAESNCAKGEWGIHAREFIAKDTILGVYYGDVFVMSKKDRADNNLHLNLTVEFLNSRQQTLHVKPNEHSFFQYANEKFALNNCALVDPLSTLPFKYNPKIRLLKKKKEKLWHTPSYKIISHQELQVYHANDYLQEVLYAPDVNHRRKHASFRTHIHENLRKYPLIVSTEDIEAYSEIFINYGAIYPREHYENNINYII